MSVQHRGKRINRKCFHSYLYSLGTSFKFFAGQIIPALDRLTGSAIGIGSHDQSVKSFDLPAVLDEVRGEPVQ